MPNIPHCSNTGNTDNTPVLCTSVLRFKHSIAFSTGHLPGFQVYFLLFFLSAGINTIGQRRYVAGDIVAGQWRHNYQMNWYANSV